MYFITIANGYILYLSIVCFKYLVCRDGISLSVFLISLLGGIFEVVFWVDPIIKFFVFVFIVILGYIIVYFHDDIINNCLYSVSLCLAYCVFSHFFGTDILLNFIFALFINASGIFVFVVNNIMPKYRLKEWLIIETYRGSKKLRMYVDTGNLLSYNGVPIIVVRAEDILDIAPINILNILGLDNGIDDVAIYPMPYSTVTGEGVLYCFFPTKCFIGNTEIKCMIAAIKGCSYFNKDCSALCNPSIMGG